MKTYTQTVEKVAKDLVEDYFNGGVAYMHEPSSLIAWMFDVEQASVTRAVKQSFQRQLKQIHEATKNKN